jgi:signal transduction histidine kinase/HAMP domain-containing protein
MDKITDSKKENTEAVGFRGIRNRMIIGILLITLVPTITVGIFSSMSASEFLLESSIQKIETDLATHTREIDQELGSIGKDVLFLSTAPSIDGIIRSGKNSGIDPLDGSTILDWETRLGSIFKSKAEVNKNYLQIRYIDQGGQELVRVDSDGTNITLIEQGDLQNKSDRSYFVETLKIKRSELFVSPFDLNREGALSEIEIPYNPVVRYSTPIFDSLTSEARGVLIINAKVENVLNRIEIDGDIEHGLDHSNIEEFVVNKDGYYLMHTDKSKEWGGTKDLNTGENIKNDFDEEMVLAILSGEAGSLDMVGHGHVLSYKSIFPGTVNNDIQLVLGTIVPRGQVLAPVIKERGILGVMVLIAGLVASIFSILFSLSISKPIVELTKMAKTLASGNLRARSNVETKDEIGLLSDVFNSLADNINESQAVLEKKVKDKTRDLEMSLKESSGKNELLEKNKIAMLNILEDIDAEKNINESNRQRLEIILDNLPVGVFIAKGLTGEAEFVNAKGVEFLGKGVDPKASSENYAKIYSLEKEDGSEYPSDELPLSVTLATGEVSEKNDIFINKGNGVRIAILAVSSPILDNNNNVTSAVGVFQDKTKEFEIDRAKTEFVSLASHQLRTPLSAINWYSEMLLSGDAGKLNDEQEKYVKEVSAGSMRMVKLVNSLLNVSRLELGTFSVDPEDTDIVRLLLSVLDEIKPKVDEKNQLFKQDFDSSLPKINIDPKLIRMVFQNLASNAVKYTNYGGTITSRLKEEEGSLVFSISDDGVGIPKAQQKNIFTKLFRADNVKATDTEGTGLGLYIVKKIVENSGGKIWLESEENKGTTFFVEIPLTGMVKKTGEKQLS